jgi:hypothetical protein
MRFAVSFALLVSACGGPTAGGAEPAAAASPQKAPSGDTSAAGTSAAGTSTAGTSTAGTSTAGTSTAGTSTAGTSTADTSAGGGQTAGPPSAGASAPFPAPYTSDQIRDATRPGRSYTWRVEVAGKPPFEKVMTFTTVDATGADLVSGGTAKRVTWDELRKHGEFPRAAVRTREEAITVPAGRYDCIVYVVADPAEGEVSQFYFAKAMPGAPVLFFTEKNGTRVMTSTLIQYAPGR